MAACAHFDSVEILPVLRIWKRGCLRRQTMEAALHRFTDSSLRQCRCQWSDASPVSMTWSIKAFFYDHLPTCLHYISHNTARQSLLLVYHSLSSSLSLALSINMVRFVSSASFVIGAGLVASTCAGLVPVKRDAKLQLVYIHEGSDGPAQGCDRWTRQCQQLVPSRTVWVLAKILS